MLLPKIGRILLEILEQRTALSLHGRYLYCTHMRIQYLQCSLVGRTAGGIMKSLLIAGILLLIGSHISLIMLHQANPLLECLQLHIPLVLQGGVNRKRGYAIFCRETSVLSSCLSTCTKQKDAK